ncbi:S1 RNA-binding domain-containing protein [Candidatus Micrarchaeota archaeon]|nr:S1 RNA-binding domain-containing protein [Candidatus Micrarchaeota archaeon]MBD3417965.1 S1 RNA-binding domain-containing protein [Candidatus Micrarchaeota archaeon]
MAQKYPEKDELVLATVTKIMPYGAFLTLKEYEGVEAFMHISEVAPRWIKNIHEFLSVNQTHVVRVHRIDLEKGQVDVSLKRVNEEEKKRKLEKVKRHTRAKKLLGVAIKNAKSRKPPEKLEAEILAQYETLYDFLEDVRDEGEKAFEGIDVKGGLHDEIVEIVKKSVKKPVIEVSRLLFVKCYEPDGVEVIKSSLGKVNAHYLGPGKYRVKLTAEDYKTANKKMDKLVKSVEKGLAGKDCEFSSEEEK